MTSRRFLAAFAAALLVLGVLDAAWLGTMVPGFYRPQLADLLASSPRWFAAVAFYLVYAVGTVILAVLPWLALARPVRRAGAMGACLGLVAYATYNLTNLATIDGRPAGLTVVDLAWGTVLTGIVAAAGAWSARRFG